MSPKTKNTGFHRCASIFLHKPHQGLQTFLKMYFIMAKYISIDAAINNAVICIPTFLDMRIIFILTYILAHFFRQDNYVPVYSARETEHLTHFRQKNSPVQRG